MMRYGLGRPYAMTPTGFGVEGFILTTLIWILAIAGIIMVFKLFNRSRNLGPESENRALSALKERYAKGEITKKEFEDIKKDIA